MAWSKFWLLVGSLIISAIAIAGVSYYIVLFPKIKFVDNTENYKITLNHKTSLTLLISSWLKYGLQSSGVWITQPVTETKTLSIRNVTVKLVDDQNKAIYLSDEIGRTVGFTSSLNGKDLIISINPYPGVLSRSDPGKTFSLGVALALLSVLKPTEQNTPQNMLKQTVSISQKLNSLKSPLFGIKQK